MNKNVGRIVSAVFVGAALTVATAPAVIAAPTAALAAQPVERHPSEEAKAFRDRGIAVKAEADALKAAANAATTPAEAQTVLDAAPAVKATAQKIDDDAQAYLNRDIPGQTSDDRIAVVQGLSQAQTAITVADEAITIATPKAVVVTPAPTTESSTPAAAPSTPAAAAAPATQPQVKVKPKGGVETGGGATAKA